ncbi:PTS lactose/cellobiose transporter subunit IIA [Clostridium sp. MSJ-4]|uniref:PTS lactose/cellobiose transporter subunit IIA n=1 Tax=Clostridium simiarum TaxID=2841506 RepID=A0ABS6F093_9CLOT|nr:PTS lactose/cellobiose transporter subunit IIA [Clostridium simiarum]MBU5591898.1 PTS lactose/cellobiose transporter subunit IIA [Clostridium simiarum]
MEQIVLNLIMNSGDARSYAMEAIQSAKDGDFNTAEDLMKKCNEQLDHAHSAQTSLIQSEASGNKTELSLLLVHAQDHLMTTLTLKDLALEIIDIHKRIDAK